MKTPRTVDKRGARYAIPASENYLTSMDIAEAAGVRPETVWRWCRQWFGELPPGRNGKGMGYRIPPIYRQIAVAWGQDTDGDAREAVRKALLDAEARKEPEGNFVVVVANAGAVHYTWDQAVESTMALHREFPHKVIRLFPVTNPTGDTQNG